MEHWSTMEYVIKEAGHACYLDKPEEFIILLRHFLAKAGV